MILAIFDCILNVYMFTPLQPVKKKKKKGVHYMMVWQSKNDASDEKLSADLGDAANQDYRL